MISIIVCHRDKERLEKLEENISTTIGTSYELIIIDNSNNQYNIFQAYNLGVKQSMGDILCFAHEDILFHTKNWGKLVCDHFLDKTTGLIGTAGGNAFPKCPAPWWNNTILNDHLVNNIKTWDKQPSYRDLKQPFKSNVIKAVAVDGYWMCIRKSLFEIISFDENTFKGFHCYDTDICFQILKAKHKIYVVYDILIEHLSKGSINLQWIESAEKLADKWNFFLPIFAKDIDHKKLPLYNIKNLLTFCYWAQYRINSDDSIRRLISKYLILNLKTVIYKEFLLLYLWKILGYKNARYPYKIFKGFFK